jgi:hypothetical protein
MVGQLGNRDMGHGTWDMGHGTWDMGHGTWDIGYGIWDMGYGIWDMGKEVMVGLPENHTFPRQTPSLEEAMTWVPGEISGQKDDSPPVATRLLHELPPLPSGGGHFVFGFWLRSGYSNPEPCG